MPIFEYKCLQCSRKFDEFIRSHSQEEELVCPSCRSTELEKLMSMFGFSSTSENGTKTSSAGSSCGSCAHKNCENCG